MRFKTVHSPKRRQLLGFTLIELMITVVVIGILAAVAYPSYLNSVRKSRRSDAVAALAAVQQAQERWRANNTTYTATLSDLGISSATTQGGFYTLSLSGASGTGYTATATAISGTSQANDTGCIALTARLSAGAVTNEPASCWSK